MRCVLRVACCVLRVACYAKGTQQACKSISMMFNDGNMMMWEQTARKNFGMLSPSLFDFILLFI